MIALFGAMGGLLVSALLLVFGVRSGDRWIVAAAVVAAPAFVGAVALFGGSL